jgi:hypothetical protein
MLGVSRAWVYVRPRARGEVRPSRPQPDREELAEGHPADVGAALADPAHPLLAAAGCGALGREAAFARCLSARVAVAVAPARPLGRLVGVDVRRRAARLGGAARDALVQGERLRLGLEATGALGAVVAPADHPCAAVGVDAHRSAPGRKCSHFCSHVCQQRVPAFPTPRTARTPDGRKTPHLRGFPMLSRRSGSGPSSARLGPGTSGYDPVATAPTPTASAARGTPRSSAPRGTTRDIVCGVSGNAASAVGAGRSPGWRQRQRPPHRRQTEGPPQRRFWERPPGGRAGARHAQRGRRTRQPRRRNRPGHLRARFKPRYGPAL